MKRHALVDGVAFVVIAVAMVVSHRSSLVRGAAFDVHSWAFHYGVQRHAPPGGPLPMYVAAVVERVFGARYLVVLWADLLVDVLRVLAMWMLVRRLVDARAAALVAVFCVLDPVLDAQPAWGAHFVELAVALAGLLVVCAGRATGRTARIYLGCAGASLALAATAVPALGAVGAIAIAIATARFPRRELAPWWLGYGGGFAVALAVAPGGVLDSLGGLVTLRGWVDAATGGALAAGGDRSWLGALIVGAALPAALVGVVAWLAARDREISLGALGVLAVPVAFAINLVMRDARLDDLSNVPRALATLVVAVALARPARLGEWLGLDRAAVLALAAIPLAADWALQLAGDGGDAPALVLGAIAIALASAHLSPRIKTTGCAALAAVGLVRVAVCWHTGESLLDRPGLRRDAAFSLHNRHLRGLKLDRAHKTALDWLAGVVPPHATCSVDPTVRALATVLDCRPPGADEPPAEYVIARDDAWVAPGYARIGACADVLGPQLADQASHAPDQLQRLVVYRYGTPSSVPSSAVK